MFCRQCGERIARRCLCGSVCLPTDHFCGNCGGSQQQEGGHASLAGDSDVNVDQRTESDSRKVPADSLTEEAERDREHYKLGRSQLQQDDIDALFSAQGEP